MNDGRSGHIGGPTLAVEVKVVDVPDMNYTSQDKNLEGDIEPRGEICMRGIPITKGYYKDAEKTAETIDKDGWLHTGDIGVIRKDGSF